MATSLAHSDAPVRTVKEIQFGILSPEDIKAYSVAKIEFPEVNDESGRPRPGGLMDPKMGTIDRNTKCETCGEGMSECPGHFGHIELARPIFHPGFMKTVKKILECVCTNCGKLKVDSRDRNLFSTLNRLQPKYRLKYVHEAAKGTMVCEEDEGPDDQGNAPPAGGHGGCGHRQPLVRREGTKMFAVYKKVEEDADAKSRKDNAPTVADKRNLSAQECHNILKKMSSADMETLGLSEEFARPDWMILTVLPVPPAPVRPSVVSPGKASAQDDLTYKLAEIIKANASLQKAEQEGSPAYIINQFIELLQYHVVTYMDNDFAGVPTAKQKGGRPIKAIRARLKGKEGRLRGNLMGKRVDFSARTVITGDPNLDLDQVGVPRSIAMNLTYPERVTPYNKHRLQELVENGPATYPGARFVVKDTSERIDLKYRRGGTPLQLEYGWIVERHLIDGDYVLFNRQPSLHKMSMMSHRVKVLYYSTFRLNLSVTSPYNADFDGDEMNLHVPQSEETRAELRQIAWVPRQIISPQANKPVMGIVQDTLCGVRKFTLKDTFCDWAQVQNILLWLRGWDGTIPPPAIMKPTPLWTGKQLVSLCIPKGINVSKFNSDKKSPIDDTDENVLVEDGEIIHGTIIKAMAGAQNNGLIHVIFREKGHVATRDFFSAIQNMVDFWLLHYGFSVGIGDTIADTATMSQITTRLREAKETCATIMYEAEQNIMTAEPGMTLRETFEHLMKTELNKARDYAGTSAQKNLKADNNVKQMVVSGSKGSFINISQMSGCVGQQVVEGKRIPFGFQHRSLPHFSQDDYGPEAGGFVENSYLRGLTPQEFFFHAMAGREGLIDTAVKTAETGYIQRRLVKAMEDVMVCYDGTVRNSSGDVLQMLYGEDGMDGAMMERQTLDTLKLGKDDFKRRYKVDLDTRFALRPKTVVAGILDDKIAVQSALDKEFEQLKKDRKTLREVFPSGESSWPLPVNIGRIIQNSKQVNKIDTRQPSDLSPIHIIESVERLADDLIVIRGDDQLSQEAQYNATLLFKSLLRSNLATRRLLEEHHLTKTAFDWVIGEIEAKFKASLVNPAEMCGILAAQSIGEPATQMTLNTFHYAGVSAKNVTLGVPRLKEIINVAERIKTPTNQVYVRDDIADDQVKTKNLASRLAHVTIRTLTSKVEIHYDPDPADTYIEEDKHFVRAMWEMPDEKNEAVMDRLSPWVFRLVLDRARMQDKGLEIDAVVNAINSTFNADTTDVHCCAPSQNSRNLVIRVRTVYQEKAEVENADEEDATLLRLEQVILDKITLGGIQGIQRVFMNQGKRTVINKNGDFDMGRREWFIETDGSNFKEVLAVDGVDAVRTYSNNSFEVFQVLGIEAGRAALLKELRNVIEFDGSYVNYRHLCLLCDLMTQRGRLMAITRHGINRTDSGPLAKSSFEETVEILMDAAAVGEKDDCKGVAENVMLGQVASMGTGVFDIALDMDLLKDVIPDARGDIARFQIQHAGAMTPGGGMTVAMTPYDTGNFSPANGRIENASFSPIAAAGDHSNFQFGELGYGVSPANGLGAATPGGGYSPTSPSYSPTSPFITSPAHTSPASPAYGGASPWVGAGMGGPTSPAYSPHSPAYASPSSPAFSPTSPMGYSPASPSFSPGQYSPASPNYSPTSPHGAPASPAYSAAGAPQAANAGAYSPASPAYSPASPVYSPASPGYGGAGANGQPGQTSPRWSGFGGNSPSHTRR
ncbi:hypothetical protein QFC20_002467 [Naganishia adeliensis]|uniref:Uncharacterized protein n=1 Tax=Naganishia adeliensis TaxID=92952 RepID=A0ACC2WJH3_9TREE|nr:hypothetical protein QFC20_002467 [Naganishia adeliensis]